MMNYFLLRFLVQLCERKASSVKSEEVNWKKIAMTEVLIRKREVVKWNWIKGLIVIISS